MAEGIQISRNLISQLVDDGEKTKKKTKKTKTKIPRNSQQSQNNNLNHKQISNNFETQKETSSAGWPLQQPPFFLPTPPSSKPELEAIRSLLMESQGVVEKLQTLEDKKLKEVTQRAKELHEKEFKLPQQKTILCQAEKEACLACYKVHVKDPLKCATVVSCYQDCVRKARNQAKMAS